jgi:hypothetical protein
VAFFTRTRPAPELRGTYQAYRPFVRQDFTERCAYCLLAELVAGGQENFELDHFRPRAKFPDRIVDFYNLYYACHPCNHIKGDSWPSPQLLEKGIRLVDLCEDDFEEHFREDNAGRWVALSLPGQYTLDLLRLNRPHLVEVRKLVRELGMAAYRPE